MQFNLQGFKVKYDEWRTWILAHAKSLSLLDDQVFVMCETFGHVNKYLVTRVESLVLL